MNAWKLQWVTSRFATWLNHARTLWLGSFQCICPGTTQLNMQGECVAMPIPTTTITSATPISSTLSPSSTTITRVSSTPLPTTTPTVTTPTVPAGAELNQVAVTLRGLTVASVSSFIINGYFYMILVVFLISVHRSGEASITTSYSWVFEHIQ